ncbi:MAG: 5,10-methylenetetrahydrofolate reductase [bacterium]|nr:5,10-methylenetetrahydrofolate reductase [bacterium]
MIVTHKKDFKEIEDRIANKKRIVIVGCSECAAVCQTGGSEQVKEMVEKVENLQDTKILATISIESPCDKRISTRDFRRIKEEIDDAETLVALTCGSGVQAISEVTGKPVVAALNTNFLGMVERLGKFHERCSHCGECILNDTAQMCPVTRCPKGVRNGPCEGISGTQCEVDEKIECVWHTIYEKMEKENQKKESPKEFVKYHEPVDWEKNHLPGEVIWERK